MTISRPTADDPVLVVCPKCARKASVVPLGEDRVRCACLACGHTVEMPGQARTLHWQGHTPTDGYFGFDLWLRTDCAGHSLWAFNLRHLEFLESYVSARLREREMDETLGWRNSSLASRLPKWIKSAGNRKALLHAIHELKSRV